MSVLDKFEDGVANTLENAGARVFKGTIEPAQIAKKAEKQMKREKLVGAGKQHAPTLYTVLVSAKDNHRLFGFYPTMAAEIETFLLSRGADAGLSFDGRPLVRFIVDEKLKSGRFDVIAENVAAPLIDQLRQEEAAYLGMNQDADKNEPDLISDQSRLLEAGISANHEADSADSLRHQLRQVHSGSDDDGTTDDDRVTGSGEFSLPENLPAADGIGEFLVPPAASVPALSDSQSVSYTPRMAEHAPAGTVLADQPQDLGLSPDQNEAATGDACLIDHASGVRYALNLSNMTIGRDPLSSIVLDDSNASRRHAALHQSVIGKWRLQDLGSTNGTLVNGRQVEQTVLRDLDELTIGVTILQFIEHSDSASGDE